MPTYTKQVIATLQNPHTTMDLTYIEACEAKLAELVADGKTDGVAELIDDYNIKRVWADQAAIDEWYAFLTPLAATHSVVIANKVITDI